MRGARRWSRSRYRKKERINENGNMMETARQKMLARYVVEVRMAIKARGLLKRQITLHDKKQRR